MKDVGDTNGFEHENDGGEIGTLNFRDGEFWKFMFEGVFGV